MKKAMINHVSLRSDFVLIWQRQSQQNLRLQSAYSLTTEVYDEIIDKVCNVWLNEITDKEK